VRSIQSGVRDVLEMGFVAVVGIAVLVLYNRLVALGARCDQAFADVDVQLKQRHDLIPNLVHTVRDFVGHERGTLEALMKARAAAMTAPTPAAQMQAESALTSRLGQLVAVVEANPQLQASAHFVSLREEIADVENKIAAARRYLNMAVTEHNTTLRQFPLNLLAKPLRLSARAFYDLGADRVFLDEAPSAKL
jgi:LemA protein